MTPARLIQRRMARRASRDMLAFIVAYGAVFATVAGALPVSAASRAIEFEAPPLSPEGGLALLTILLVGTIIVARWPFGQYRPCPHDEPYGDVPDVGRGDGR
ncbi:hypothetical protein [uncultured Enterovirga sp.]|uniref:hypothetical protein n=1 Tax=uncultured Enterovirga sp. TaxID=2026352 RepID=UPI0035CA3F44